MHLDQVKAKRLFQQIIYASHLSREKADQVRNQS